MIRISHILCVVAAALSLGSLATVAYADGPRLQRRTGTERHLYPHRRRSFHEYMHYLATTFKKEQEAAKAPASSRAYDVLVGQPHNPQDPDIILVIEYKNWAASTTWAARRIEVSVRSKARWTPPARARQTALRSAPSWVRRTCRSPVLK